jgi:hypothetical protein
MSGKTRAVMALCGFATLITFFLSSRYHWLIFIFVLSIATTGLIVRRQRLTSFARLGADDAVAFAKIARFTFWAGIAATSGSLAWIASALATPGPSDRSSSFNLALMQALAPFLLGLVLLAVGFHLKATLSKAAQLRSAAAPEARMVAPPNKYLRVAGGLLAAAAYGYGVTMAYNGVATRLDATSLSFAAFWAFGGFIVLYPLIRRWLRRKN